MNFKTQFYTSYEIHTETKHLYDSLLLVFLRDCEFVWANGGPLWKDGFDSGDLWEDGATLECLHRDNWYWLHFSMGKCGDEEMLIIEFQRHSPCSATMTQWMNDQYAKDEAYINRAWRNAVPLDRSFYGDEYNVSYRYVDQYGYFDGGDCGDYDEIPF